MRKPLIVIRKDRKQLLDEKDREIEKLTAQKEKQVEEVNRKR